MESLAPTIRFTNRTATAEDQPLLFALFTAEKREEFSPLNLNEEQLTALIEMQFRAREFSYSSAYPGAVDVILCLEDGRPIGRHLVQRNPSGMRSIDISILPEYRGRGLGEWSLRNLQQAAQSEGLAVELRVIKSNPALRLYERLGFTSISGDEVSFEMRWEPTNLRAPARPSAPKPHDIAVMSNGSLSRDEFIECMTEFLRELGLTIEFALVLGGSVPGIELIGNGLRVDCDALLYPGDMLHEAARIALMAPEERAQGAHAPTEAAFRIAAIAWAWAAAHHLNIPDAFVIHDDGYKGMAPQIRYDFASGKCPGLPILAWLGMTTPSLPEQPSIYPRMLQWLRPAEHTPSVL